MSTTSVEDAILASHRKASEVRSVCAVYDRILLDVRQEYQFPVEPEKWAAGLAERLEFLNKDYRRTVRSNTQTLATRLENLYGRRATAGLSTVVMANQHSTVQESSLVPVSKPSLVERKVDELVANLMRDLFVRVDVALQLCISVEDLVPRMTRLYETHGDAIPLLQRVLLRQNVSRFQRGLREALTYKQQIQRTMEEWPPYFEVLTSETALARLLDKVHTHKLTTKAFLSEVTPVVERFRALRDKRDDIMNKSTALSFAHEIDWLPLRSTRLPNLLVADELGKYDNLLEDAKQQRAAHEDILRSLEALKYRSMSPQVVVGPGGVDLHLSRLALAYVEFRQVHFTCNAVTRLAGPLLGALEADIKTLSERERDADAEVVTE